MILNKFRTFIHVIINQITMEFNFIRKIRKKFTKLFNTIIVTIVYIIFLDPPKRTPVTVRKRRKYVHVYKVGRQKAAIEEGPSFNSRGPLSRGCRKILAADIPSR